MGKEQLKLIAFIGGGKGGVGKSLLAMLLMYYLMHRGYEPVLVDTDTDNQDVYKCYKDKPGCKAILQPIDDPKGNGWNEMIDIIIPAMEEGHPVVINTKAGNRNTLINYGDVLNEIDNVSILWVVDEKRDALVALDEFLKIVQKPVCVVKNRGVHVCREDEFTEFDAFNKAHNDKIKSVFMECATSSITNKLYGKERKTIDELKDEMTVGGRAMLNSWLKKSIPMCEQMLKMATDGKQSGANENGADSQSLVKD